MTLIQLESFLRTAETMSFTAAAEKLYVSRQVVSAHVKALESELGCALFQRGGRSVSLTENGAILFRRLSALEGQLRAAIADAKARVDTITELRVGVCELREDWDWRLYAFTEMHPNCRLNVEIMSQNALQDGLLERRYDMVVSLYEDLTKAATTVYAIRRLRPMQAVIAVSRRHPLALRDTLSTADLDGEKLFCISENYAARAKSMILGDLERHGARPREVLEFPNYKSLALALVNDGAAVTFDAFLPNPGDRLKVFPVRQMEDVPIIQLACAFRRDGSPLLEELADYLRDTGL